jgi:type 1 glutamine amidotransferase
MFVLALAAAAVSVSPTRPAAAKAPKKRVLVLAETKGFHHSSIPTAISTVKALGDKTGAWEVVSVAEKSEEVAAAITADNLKNVDLVFFANTTGNLDFTPEGHKAFYDWIKAGGAYAGVHSASDTFHGDPDYLNLIRGEFQTHGAQVTVQAFVQDPDHPACKELPASFEAHDEIYEFQNWGRDKCHVLLSMHNHPQPPHQPGDFPIAWTNRLDKGRMFYTSLGHREDMYENPLYLKHLTGGMMWALGLAEGSDTPGNPVK